MQTPKVGIREFRSGLAEFIAAAVPVPRQAPRAHGGVFHPDTRYFYKPQPLRTLAEIATDIVAAEKDAKGLLDGLLMAEAPF